MNFKALIKIILFLERSSGPENWLCGGDSRQTRRRAPLEIVLDTVSDRIKIMQQGKEVELN